MSRSRTFDNRDVTHIRYGEIGWPNTGSWKDRNGGSGTLASTNDQNAKFTFTFPEPAIEFQYYGMRRCCGASYTICIDCDPDNPQPETIDALDRSDDGMNPPQLLYSKKFTGPPGVHEIIIQNRPDTRFPETGNNSQITLDRIELVLPDNPSSTSFSSTRIGTGTSTAGATSKSSSPVPSPTSPPSPGSTNKVLAGALGGALSGLSLIALILLVLFCRRRRRRKELSSEPYPVLPMTRDTPSSGSRMIMSSSEYYDSTSNDNSNSSGAPLPPLPRNEKGRNINSTPRGTPSSESRRQTGAYSDTTSSSAARSRRVRERDAGLLMTSDDGDDEDETSTNYYAETLPPDYDQVFLGRRVRKSRMTRSVTMSGSGG